MTVWVVSQLVAGICGVFASEELAEQHIIQKHSLVPRSWLIKTEVILDIPMCHESIRDVK